MLSDGARHPRPLPRARSVQDRVPNHRASELLLGLLLVAGIVIGFNFSRNPMTRWVGHSPSPR